MLCDICGGNEATVHLTEIINDKMTKLHLCEGCARKKGGEMEEHFGLNDLLAGLADFGTQLETDVSAKATCPNCGLSYTDFKRTGRLGCGDCYETFRKNLAPLLKRIHGSDRHIGKTPRPVSKRPKVISEKDRAQELRKKLQEAIRMEEFEEAARLRDKIRILETRPKR